MKDGSPVRAQLGDIREMKAYIDAQRVEKTPFDIVVEGKTPGNNRKRASAIVRRWEDAGATWWLEADWSLTDTMWKASTQKRILARILQGPPRDKKLEG
jgi:hypothetical protein